MGRDLGMNKVIIVSIIVPCRNEEKYIAYCLDSIIANDYPKDSLEVLVVDGISNDCTRKIISEYSRNNAFIKLLDNNKKITATAINIGISRARGRVIILMGAHTAYPPNYISGLVSWLEKTGADVVGGICKTLPANDTPIAQAIALGLSHPFGVGNSYFRIGTSSPRPVDTVPFGCYRREVFDRIGGFDEELVRNQDDEFNLRLMKKGGRIVLVPEIVSHYYARESLSKVARMFFQYGYFKPLVARKVGGILTARQVAPAALIATLLLTGTMAILSPLMGKIFSSILILYIVVDLGFSALSGLSKGIRCGFWLSLVFPTLHFSYGLGFLKGLMDFFIYKHKNGEDLAKMPISR